MLGALLSMCLCISWSRPQSERWGGIRYQDLVSEFTVSHCLLLFKKKLLRSNSPILKITIL